MSAIFSKPKSRPLPVPPERSSTEVQTAAAEEARRRALASGRSSTILTDPAQAFAGGNQLGTKTLLG